ncbi:MAG: DedA family protein [Alphaproteobacteria bacterium]|nr:DedA family protein [Alphaproteobacteria bacterium]
MESLIHFLVEFVHALGYAGLFIMTMLESTFLPIPSEITMIPAGYLVHEGKFALVPAYLCSVAGTLAGALINYWIAWRWGRGLLLRHPKIFFVTEEKLLKIEKFFARHGHISVFTGRLIFGVRHFISFPAGLAKMDLKEFCFYTAAGAAIWVAVLMGAGYMIGRNEAAMHEMLPVIKNAVLLFVALLIGVYVYRQKKKNISPRSHEEH